MAIFTNRSGDNIFHGTAASDTLKFSGPASGYRIEYLSNGIVRVVDINSANGNQGSDLLTNIDRLTFSDKSYSISLTGSPSDFLPLPAGDKAASPIVAGLANGDYVLSWLRWNGTNSELFTRQHDKYGLTVGDKEQVSNTTDIQGLNKILPLANGGYVIAWQTDIDEMAGTKALHIQRFDQNGVKVGTATQLDTDELASTYGMTLLDDGSYVVAWLSKISVSDGHDSYYDFGIYTQKFDAAGNTQGSATFSSEAYGLQCIPLTNGEYALLWMTDGSADIHLQLFNGDGTAAGGSIVRDTGKPWFSDYSEPAITTFEDGSFVVAWKSLNGEIYAQHFGSNGQAIGTAFAINTYKSNAYTGVSATTLTNGDYVVAWNSDDYPGTNDTGADAIYVQRIDSTGTKIGPEMRVNSHIGFYTGAPSITALADGGYLVTWTTEDAADGGTAQTFAQRFDANGNAYALSTQTITGASASDTINAGSGNQSISGLGGNDILRGGSGNDILNGGTGNDGLYGGTGNDTYILSDADRIFENSNEGTDTVKAAISYTLSINLENLTLTGGKAINGNGNARANKLIGNSGNNALDGKAGNDTLDGGAGRDTLIGGAGNDIYIIRDADIIRELDSFSFDTVRSSITYTLGANLERLELTGNAAINGTGNTLDNGLEGNDAVNTLIGGAGDDSIVGKGGNDKLYGGNGGDWLLGGDGNDTVYGDAGDDYIHAGPGSDKLYGGYGKDVFVFQDDITGVDTLMDYSIANDTIHLAIHVVPEIDARGPLNKGNFAANVSGMALDANDYILYETWSGRLYYDADGSGAGAKVLLAIIGSTNHPALTHSDIVIT